LALHFPALQIPPVEQAPSVHPVAHNSHFLEVAFKTLSVLQESHASAFEQVLQL